MTPNRPDTDPASRKYAASSTTGRGITPSDEYQAPIEIVEMAEEDAFESLELYHTGIRTAAENQAIDPVASL